jgi:hypothetical protein
LAVYLIVFGILGLVALLMELPLTRRSRIGLLAISYLILVVLVGLRWETGNDWPNYYEYYRHAQFLKDNAGEFEIGYRFFTLVIKHLGMSFAGFNLIYAAIYLGLFFLSFKRENFEVSGWLLLQLFSPFLFGLMGTTRQVMAIAICMFSVRYLLSRELLKFLLCIVIATAFHISGLAFLIAWPVPCIRLSKLRIWIVFVALTIASLLHVGDILFEFAAQRVTVLQMANLEAHLLGEQGTSAADFNNAAGSLSTIAQVVGRFALLFVFTLCFDLYREQTDQTYFKLYVISIVIVVLFSGPAYVLALRVALYFSLFQIHLLALLTRRMPNRLARQLCCIALLALSFVRLWSAVYFIRPRIFVPYKAVFFNQDVKRDPGWF